MRKVDRVILSFIFVLLLMVMVFQIGIYWNTKPQEEYETISVSNVSINTTGLEEAGYFEPLEDTGFHRGPCEICEAIQRGEITPTVWLEKSDNFTVIMEEGAYDLSEPTFNYYPNNTHNIIVKRLNR